jgi:DNA-binding MarR family transcriptional regulator
MSAKLATEIKQTKPFRLLEEEALLNLVRTHEFLQQRQAAFFKQYELTPTQYNILRILRGAGEEGITCSRASERMVTADPDITRLFDRLEARGLVRRERGSKDRRVVISRITREGMKLLAAIDGPLEECHRRLMGRVGRKKLVLLIEILESLREE